MAIPQQASGPGFRDSLWKKGGKSVRPVRIPGIFSGGVSAAGFRSAGRTGRWQQKKPALGFRAGFRFSGMAIPWLRPSFHRPGQIQQRFWTGNLKLLFSAIASTTDDEGVRVDHWNLVLGTVGSRRRSLCRGNGFHSGSGSTCSRSCRAAVASAAIADHCTATGITARVASTATAVAAQRAKAVHQTEARQVDADLA